jgi:hypothetical protein
MKEEGRKEAEKQERGKREDSFIFGSCSFNKKAAIRARLHCTRATKPQQLSNNVALFQHGLSTQNNREVTKIMPLFQRKSRDPYQASLHAHKKAAAAFEHAALFQHGLSTQNNREVTKTMPLFQRKSRDPCQASLHAHKKAAAAFEQCGFISARPFNTKQPRGHKKQSRSFNKKVTVRARLHCTRATKSAAAFEQRGFISARPFNTKQPRGHKNNAALSTKKPRSVPGFIVRMQQSRNGFRKMRLYFSTAFQHKTTER